MAILFRDIKQNHTVHVLDKETMEYKQCKALSISFPHMVMTQSGTQSVVDVNIEMNGSTAQYQIPDHSFITYTGNLVLATEADSIIRELESTISTAEQIINSAPRQEEIKKKAEELMAQLDPKTREKKNIEDRFNNIESRFNNFEKSTDEMKRMLSDFISEFKK